MRFARPHLPEHVGEQSGDVEKGRGVQRKRESRKGTKHKSNKEQQRIPYSFKQFLGILFFISIGTHSAFILVPFLIQTSTPEIPKLPKLVPRGVLGRSRASPGTPKTRNWSEGATRGREL